MKMDKQQIKNNWNFLWKIQMQKHQENYVQENELWQNQDIVKEYDRMAQNSQWKDIIIKKIDKIKNPENLKILDIGSGPGTHSIPLALKAHHITSVEPSNAMLNCMKEKIKKMKIKNIKCINKLWQDVNTDEDLKCPYDIVIASFSLSVTDLKNAIEKIDVASKKYVYIIWHIGTPDWEKNCFDIWERLHRKKYYEIPKTDLLFNILCQMNIYPNIETHSINDFYRFTDFDSAVEYFKKEFFIKDYDQIKILRDYLKVRLARENGHLLLKGNSNYALIWWDKTKN